MPSARMHFQLPIVFALLAQEALMGESTRSGRRQFLKHTAALAGVAVGAGAGAEWTARSQSGKPEVPAKDALVPGEQLRRGVPSRRGTRMSVDHITFYTPLQDYGGIITPAQLHFVSRVHFLECQGNSSGLIHHGGNPNMGLPVQYIWGMTSCSEWTGVPLSVLLNEVGLKKEASWLVYEGADPGKFSHTVPLGKALDDVFVAYGQNGEPLRVEQGYPIRMIVPGWEGPFSVKYLRHIKVTDQPYHAWNEAMNHSIPRADLGGKSRWYHFQWAAKSVITRPSGGLKLAGPGYVQITGLAWSGGGAITKVEVSTNGG